MNSGYTSNEIAQMRSDKEAEIKQLEFDIKMAEAEYKIMKKEFDNGEVKSEIDGYVVSVLTPEEALANKEPVVKVSPHTQRTTASPYLGWMPSFIRVHLFLISKNVRSSSA